MARQRCFRCGGSGRMPCTICNGRGHTRRMTANMELDISPCYPTMRCSNCGGSGHLETAEPASRPGGRVPDRPTSPPPRTLEGRWQAFDGSAYEFTGGGPEYFVVAQSPTGVTRGRATLNGRKAAFFIDVPLIGRVDSRAEVDSSWNRMTVTTTLFGIAIPVPFDRVSWPDGVQ